MLSVCFSLPLDHSDLWSSQGWIRWVVHGLHSKHGAQRCTKLL